MIGFEYKRFRTHAGNRTEGTQRVKGSAGDEQKRAYVTQNLTASVLEECVALSKIIALSRRTAAENAGRIRQGSGVK